MNKIWNDGKMCGIYPVKHFVCCENMMKYLTTNDVSYKDKAEMEVKEYHILPEREFMLRPFTLREYFDIMTTRLSMEYGYQFDNRIAFPYISRYRIGTHHGHSTILIDGKIIKHDDYGYFYRLLKDTGKNICLVCNYHESVICRPKLNGPVTIAYLIPSKDRTDGKDFDLLGEYTVWILPEVYEEGKLKTP